MATLLIDDKGMTELGKASKMSVDTVTHLMNFVMSYFREVCTTRGIMNSTTEILTGESCSLSQQSF